jgi:3-methyl-2-oxobutanoate hydroxymethyltransferase
MKKWTASKIRALKGKEKLTSLTAYDAITGRIGDLAGLHVILVGDSLSMTALGLDSTLPATMDIMVHHVAAVCRGVHDALVVADMPFLSYRTVDEALVNAGRFLAEAGADAVKLEGGECRAETIRALVDNGIPVMAHIGVLPQSVRASGYRAKGGAEAEAEQLLRDADAVAAAGAFSVVLECIRTPLPGEITRRVPIPTFSVGSGAECDGQMLVFADALGLVPDAPCARFVRQFAQLGQAGVDAVRSFIDAVRSGEYPAPEHEYR